MCVCNVCAFESTHTHIDRHTHSSIYLSVFLYVYAYQEWANKANKNANKYDILISTKIMKYFIEPIIHSEKKIGYTIIKLPLPFESQIN